MSAKLSSASPAADFVALWIRERRRLAAVAGMAFVVSLILVLTVAARFQARAKLAPIGRDPTGSRLGVLASQFAALAGGAGVVESVEYYAELIRSRDLLGEIVTAPIAPSPVGAADSVNLIELWKAKGDTPTDRTRAAAKRLSGAVSVVTSRDANLVTVYVTTSDPALSIAICSRIISAVNEFNLTKRHGRATAERAFTETRLADVRTALRHAEEALKSFNERNRPPLLSAQLRMEAQRLQREVDLQQSLFLSLAQALEQAKIDEVRDTPVVTVVERPDLTVARELNPLIAALTFALIATATAATALWIRQRH